MNNTVDHIRTMQEGLRITDNTTLHQAISTWHRKERRCQLQVLMHLAEIEQRKLYLDLGAMHLADYCQRYLQLSDNEAWLRVYVARAGLRFPGLLVAMADGAISLSVAGMLARQLRDDNVEELLQSCSGKSKREVEELLAARGVPSPPQRSSLRPIFVPLGKADESSPCQDKSGEHPDLFRDSSQETSTKEPVENELRTMLVHKLSCTISNETKEKLLRLAEVLGIVDPLANLDLVITKATDLALRVKDPAHRSAQKTPVAQDTSPEGESGLSTPEKVKNTVAQKRECAPESSSSAAPRSRYIAVAVRRTLLTRAAYRCEFTSPEGIRCCQRTDLEIDHIYAFSCGGGNDISNLQVLCSAHNRRKYERERECASHRVHRKTG
jgi:hypothetical protein